MRRRRHEPVRRNDDGSYVLELDGNEREILSSFVMQLRDLVQGDDPDARTRRLFPTAYSADEAADEEWQRLMRDELMQSRIAAIDRVSRLLQADCVFTDDEMAGLMITVNALRLVLGTVLDITDDGPDAEPDPDDDDQVSAQWHLYQWLGWLLEWIVEARQEA